MFRGYRLLILALGLILCGATAPPQPERGTKQDGPGKQAPIVGSSSIDGQSPEYQEPCKGQEQDRKSDLCAQWTAANAARDAADWAYVGLWLTGASIIGLLVTLLFNWSAWRQARKGKNDTIRALDAADRSADAATRLVEIAADNAQKQLRAYLDFEGVRIDKNPEFVGPMDTNGRTPMLLVIGIRNFGKTPAKDVEVHIDHLYRSSGQLALRYFTEIKQTAKFFASTISPSDIFHYRINCAVFDDDVPMIESGSTIIHLQMIVTYTSVFGGKHVLRCSYEGVGIKEDFSIVEGTRAST